jgi:hypothetical protein
MAAHWIEAIVTAGILLSAAVAAMMAVGLEDLDSVASPPEFPDETCDAGMGTRTHEDTPTDAR